MPTSFLDLPREIRDFIYEHALVSPTGCIMPIANKCSRFSIYTAVDFDLTNNIPPELRKHIPSVLSLSLPRTCRQIYEESKGMFWSNTFLFADLPNMNATLKSMGQAPSRKIRFISVHLNPIHWHSLPKAFALLTSRARHGAFKTLHLKLPRAEFVPLIKWKHFGRAREAGRYDQMLELLRESSEECHFQRSIEIRNLELEGEGELDTARDLHLALGGRMIYKGKLQWDNYEHVGNRVGI